MGAARLDVSLDAAAVSQSDVRRSGVIPEDWPSRPSFSIPVPPSRVGDVAELRLDVRERGVISDVLGRLGGHFARSSLSVAKQLKWDNTGTHAQ